MWVWVLEVKQCLLPFEHINLSFVLCGSGDKREAGFAEIESELLHLHLASLGLLRSLFLVSAQRQGTKSCFLSKSMLTRLVQSLVLSPERKLLCNNCTTQILSLRRVRDSCLTYTMKKCTVVWVGV